MPDTNDAIITAATVAMAAAAASTSRYFHLDESVEAAVTASVELAFADIEANIFGNLPSADAANQMQLVTSAVIAATAEAIALAAGAIRDPQLKYSPDARTSWRRTVTQISAENADIAEINGLISIASAAIEIAATATESATGASKLRADRHIDGARVRVKRAIEIAGLFQPPDEVT